MRRSTTLAAVAFALSSPAAADSIKNPELPSWMAGCWEQRKGEQWTEECWTSPKAGIMLGSSRTGKGGKLIAWEAMQIILDYDNGDGPVVGMAFQAAPSGTNPTIFRWSPDEQKGVTFYNAAHDYPQRIRYWREGKELKAQISLLDGSKPMDFSWKMMRQ